MRAISRRSRVYACACIFGVLTPALGITSNSTTEPLPFDDCLSELRGRALADGVSAQTVEAAFPSIERNERIIELDRKQPEFVSSFQSYLDRAVSPKRIDTGRDKLAQHQAQLADVYRSYGVPPRYLVAFWGLETNYGGYFGKLPVLDSLATLACDTRRSEFFGHEFIHALHILDSQAIELDAMRGSWAGAMGHTQFIPSTYRAHAVDGNGDGQIDLWNSLPDVFASSANFLRIIGWQPGERWGREVRLPADFPWAESGLSTRKSVTEWKALGITRADGRPLADSDLQGSILVPAGHRGPAFIVYDNFRVIMRWNASISYALAVGHLADRIVGGGELAQRAPEEKALRISEMETIQRQLTALGFDSGEPDGRLGPKTRAAIRAFQQQAGLPADGHADQGLLEALRMESQSRQTDSDPAAPSL